MVDCLDKAMLTICCTRKNYSLRSQFSGEQGVMFSGETVRREDVQGELKEIAFDFFYWFSRFEFALKESRLLKRNDVGENAEPGWDAFIERYAHIFKHSEQTRELLELNPKRQRVGPHSVVEWKEVGMSDCQSDLC